MSGPILKQHLFFYVGWSQTIQPVTTYGTASVLTPEAQSGVYRYVGSDGVTRTVNVLQVAGGGGYQTSISPTIQAQFGRINNSVTQGFLNYKNIYSNSLNYALSGRNINRYPAARIDWMVNDRLRLNLSGTLDWATTYDLQPPFPGKDFEHMRTRKQATHWTSSLGVEYVFSPRTVTEFKAGFLSALENFSPGLNPPDSSRTINWPLSLTSGLTIPIAHSTNSPVATLTDSTHHQAGKHSLDFGATYSATDVTGHQNAGGYLTYSLGIAGTDPVAAVLTNSAFPSISTSSLTEARNLYALLTGRVSSISTSLNYDPNTGKYAPYIQRFADFRQVMGGLFLRDSWRLSPQLTVNFGVRWDAFGSWFDNTGTMLASTYSDIWGPSGEGNLFKPGTLPGNASPVINPLSHFYDTSWKNFSPSGGFAWNPTGSGWIGKLLGDRKTVIRGGYSRNYFTVGSYTIDSLLGSTGLTSSASTSPGLPGFVAGQVTLDTPAPPISYTTTRVVPLQISSYSFGSSPGVAAIKPKIATSYVQSWSFGIQRQLLSNIVEVRYVGNRADDLWRTYGINEVNIFENGFLQDFAAAQNNLAINQASGVTSFANLGSPGQKPIALFESAFGALGSNAALTSAQGFGSGGVHFPIAVGTGRRTGQFAPRQRDHVL